MPTEVEGTHQIGDISLYTKTWIPDGPPKAHLVFIHGFDDHINRYYELFPTLASSGIQTHSFDQRGWGRSVHSPADKGRTGPTSLVISDIVSFITPILDSEEATKTPVFILGHSMGGGEVLTLASEPQYKDITKRIRGWLLESPYIGLSPESEPNPVTVFVGKLAAKILPHKQMFNPIPPEKLTQDPEVIKSIKEDKLLHGTGTLEGLSSMLERTKLLGDGKRVLNEGVRSIWLGHGTKDQGTSYEASKKWFEEQKGVEDKEFKTYEGWFHQLHADRADNREVFAADVRNWILKRSGEEGLVKGVGSKL